MIFIGIDPGTHTGLAVWDTDQKKLTELCTLPIHQALHKVEEYKERAEKMCVVFEDARQRTWYGVGKNDRSKLQGAGSIKRDCSIWEDFCQDLAIPFRAIAPHKGMTKHTEAYFKLLTGWDKKTSNHARDAAMLVLGMYE